MVAFPPGHIDRAASLFHAGDGSGLLLNPAIQEDLKLSADQVTKIRDLAQELQREADKLDKQEARKKIFAINAKGAKSASDILKPEQRARIRQIQIQIVGPAWFLDTELAKKIKLTDKQTESIRAAYNDGRLEHLRALIRKKDHAVEMKEYNDATMAKVMKYLSEEQKAAYAKMAEQAFQGELPLMRAGTSGAAEEGINRIERGWQDFPTR